MAVSSPPVPKEIRDFVARHLRSVEHLEAFILLRQNTARAWTSREIAEELHIAGATADTVLEHLASDNFLDVKISSDILFRYSPASAKLAEIAARCAEYYGRERMAIVNLVPER